MLKFSPGAKFFGYLLIVLYIVKFVNSITSKPVTMIMDEQDDEQLD